MQNNVATQHRLGIARTALKRILDYKGNEWEDDLEYIGSLRMIAEDALKKMNTDVDKRRRRIKDDQRKHIERVAREVKKEVAP